MSGTDTLEAATVRLMAALDDFEDSVALRLKDEQGKDDLAAQVRSLVAEREQLFSRLEDERRRAEQLEAASEEVSERLGTVIDSVKTIMQTN